MDPNQRPSPKFQSREGRYANYVKVGYNAFEFVIDFGQYYPENDDAELHTRIITSPTVAKEICKTLLNAVTGYERQFEEIDSERM